MPILIQESDQAWLTRERFWIEGFFIELLLVVVVLHI
jgi:hypothetical protein